MLAREEVCNFRIGNLDACCITILEEHITVQKGLPGRIADLLLALLILNRRTCGDFVDSGKIVYLCHIIFIGNACACDFPYVLRLAEEIHQVVHRGNEVQE